MARDLDKRLRETERLLKQGKSAAATRELRMLAEESARDPLVLNRIGDFLYRIGQKAEALSLFDRIAEEFTRAGFYPQAVAVLKKILRSDPQHLVALLLLGEVYAKQKLFADSRVLLLRAAQAYVHAKQFDLARQVYVKLVAVDPKEPLHRVGLAETKILLNDGAGGAAELIAAGEDLVAAGRPQEGEKAFRRAAEIGPKRAEAFAGIARCLVLAGRNDEAVAFLEDASRRPVIGPMLTGDLFVLYERTGKTAEARRFLSDDRAEGLDDASIEGMVRVHVERGDAPEAWKRIDPLLTRWAEYERFDRLVPLLERLARIEGEEIPALERLHRALRIAKDREGLGRALEALVRAYWARSMHAQASAAMEELREVFPKSVLVAESLARRSLGDAPAAPDAAPAVSAVERSKLALPESQSDREFVAGHLAESDAFRRHDLHDKALEQVRAVLAKFPGHVEAHERAVAILRSRGDSDATRAALVALALTRNAAGDLAGALETAEEAQRQGPVAPADRAALESAGLLTPAKPAMPAPIAPVVRPSRSGPAARADDDEPEIEILFDDGSAPGQHVMPAPASKRRRGEAPDDSLEEVSFFLDQGMRDEALQRLAELRTLGYGGAKLEELERRASGSARPKGGAGSESSVLRLDDGDLDSISQALEAALGTSTEAPLSPESPPAGTQEGIDDVFAAFKEQVAAEVGADDYRTHYDLGIAYKEMGLVDDAIGEFLTATRSPDKLRDACSMLGLCHRERGELDVALEWLRKAISAPGGSDSDEMGLRYEMADVLAASGDVSGALRAFGEILAVDPGYRDVVARVGSLRASPHS